MPLRIEKSPFGRFRPARPTGVQWGSRGDATFVGLFGSHHNIKIRDNAVTDTSDDANQGSQIFIGGESGEAPASPTGLLVRGNTLTKFRRTASQFAIRQRVPRAKICDGWCVVAAVTPDPNVASPLEPHCPVGLRQFLRYSESVGDNVHGTQLYGGEIKILVASLLTNYRRDKPRPTPGG